MRLAFDSVEQLLDAVADGRRWRREPFSKTADSLSGAPFERVVIDGTAHVLKHISRDLDWIMRVTGDGTDGPPRVVPAARRLLREASA